MKTVNQVISELLNKKSEILGNNELVAKLSKGISQYIYLQEKYDNNDMDVEFKKKFAYFYRMNPYVGNEYKEEFFKILQDIKNGSHRSFSDVAEPLYNIENKHQFSFITKLLHTTNTNHPIYDSLVSKVLGLPSLTLVKERRDKMILSKQIINDVNILYAALLDDTQIQEILNIFDERFSAQISNVKKIDFILWAYGSTLK